MALCLIQCRNIKTHAAVALQQAGRWGAEGRLVRPPRTAESEGRQNEQTYFKRKEKKFVLSRKKVCVEPNKMKFGM
jgi:hypothetical protein